MQSQALKKTNNETNSVGAGEFKIGWRRKLTVDLNDLLQQDCDGAYTVPQKNRKIIESLSFSAEEIESLLAFFRNSKILDVLNNAC